MLAGVVKTMKANKNNIILFPHERVSKLQMEQKNETQQECDVVDINLYAIEKYKLLLRETMRDMYDIIYHDDEYF